MNPNPLTSASTSAAANTSVRARILCVDDDAQVLDGLTLHLRRRYDVVTALGGEAAVQLIKQDQSIAVVISDMRMPGMDGATFLRQARAWLPEATRMLLTGQTDINSAVSAINEGQIFRFLTKPCAPPLMAAAVEAALEQHRLVTSERVLLEQTLHGSIKVLTDVLALNNPLAFGRATRTKLLVGELAQRTGFAGRWQVEVAAMLSQLGTITLRPELVEKIYYAQALSDDEQRQLQRSAELTGQLLANIPRIDAVRDILKLAVEPRRPSAAALTAEQEHAATGAALLKTAVDFDVLQAEGNEPAMALGLMRSKPGVYRPEVLDALTALVGQASDGQALRELPLAGLRIGMVFAADVKLATGVLLVPRGQELTASLLERIQSFRPGTLPATVRMILPSG